MGKLFKLREWLNVPEAAQYLSFVLGEEVTEADVLRLALDRQLKLSVNFVNHARVWVGVVVPIDQGEFLEWPSGLPLPHCLADHPTGKPILVLHSDRLDDKHCLRLSKEVTEIKGVWDLPLIGSEKLDIEHRYQQLTGGPDVTLVCMDGTLLEGPDGELCKLVERLDLGDYKTSDIPAGGLPGDSVLVVRMKALLEFQQRIATQPDAPKSLGPRAETTYLNIIGALLGLVLGETPSGKGKPLFGNRSAVISAITEYFPGKDGLSSRTLDDKFARAKHSLESHEPPQLRKHLPQLR